MRLLSLLLFGTLAALPLRGQSAFPSAWAGEWRGTMTHTTPPDSVRLRVPIHLSIAREAGPERAWRWREVFNSDTTRGLKDYRLIERDAATGRYAVDERNGVLLEARLIGDVLESVFEVGDQVLASRYQLRGDTLVHDLSWWPRTPSSRTSGTGPNGEGGMPVMSFEVRGRQRSVMTRVR
jgi:hypothetical protein